MILIYTRPLYQYSFNTFYGINQYFYSENNNTNPYYANATQNNIALIGHAMLIWDSSWLEFPNANELNC